MSLLEFLEVGCFKTVESSDGGGREGIHAAIWPFSRFKQCLPLVGLHG